MWEALPATEHGVQLQVFCLAVAPLLRMQACPSPVARPCEIFSSGSGTTAQYAGMPSTPLLDPLLLPSTNLQ